MVIAQNILIPTMGEFYNSGRLFCWKQNDDKQNEHLFFKYFIIQIFKQMSVVQLLELYKYTK